MRANFGIASILALQLGTKQPYIELSTPIELTDDLTYSDFRSETISKQENEEKPTLKKKGRTFTSNTYGSNQLP